MARFNGLDGLLPGIYAVHILKDTDEIEDEKDYKTSRNQKKRKQTNQREFDNESFEAYDEYEL